MTTLKCKNKLCFFLVFLLAAPALLNAKNYHSLDDIRNIARSFIMAETKVQSPSEEIEISVRQLDPRLKLKPCKQKLNASLAQHGLRGEYASVMVSCNANTTWSLYVPVKITRYLEVLVYANPVERNDILDNSDVKLAKMNVSRLNTGYTQDIQNVIGKVMQQNKMLGNIVLNSHYKNPLMVKRGEDIVLVSKSQTIEVRMKGTALAQGSMGDKIRVKNSRSKRIVNGTIIGPGLISVDS